MLYQSFLQGTLEIQKDKVQAFDFTSIKRHFLGSFKGLTSEILCFVPKRSFGQGQKIRIFGHAKKKSASKYPDIWPFLIGK